MEKTDILGLSLFELTAVVTSLGEASYRAKQLFSWLHQQRVKEFSKMTNLPKPLLASLEEQFVIPQVRVKEVFASRLDATVKYLFELGDGALVEAVLMEYSYGNSLCISTQVGCNMGCAFCASALFGKERDLTCGELLGQIDEAGRQSGRKINHLVLMGMGEPLDNFAEVTRFLDRVSEGEGRQISPRHITLSTCGIVPKIYELADQKRQITLAISLHAATDEERSALMPVNKAYPLRELKESLEYYFNTTGRRISFEYTLIRGKNDRPEDLKKLADFLGNFPCHINLIPVNPVKERGLAPPEEGRIKEICAWLEQRGYSVTRRRSLGQDISAACGQLRRTRLETT